MQFSCIVVAAGRGRRARSPINKCLVRAGDVPILYYSLKRFAALKECVQIVLVASRDDLRQERLDRVQLMGEMRVSGIVEGGERRIDSVRNGFALTDPQVPLVAVHDASRPFVQTRTILAVVREAQRWGAAVAAVPVSDTLKTAGEDMFVGGTVPRENLFCAQTPQAFRRQLLERALAGCRTGDVTDEAQLVELMGQKVRLVESQTTNLKVTTAEDLEMAVRLLPARDVE